MEFVYPILIFVVMGIVFGDLHRTLIGFHREHL